MDFVRVGADEDAAAEDGDDAHHLGAADGLAHPALAAPREVRLAPLPDLAHRGDKVREEGRVEALFEGVDAHLVEDVELAGGGGVGAERGAFGEGARFVVFGAREAFWWEELREGEDG